MKFMLLPWKPELVFTGLSIMGVNPQNLKFNSHVVYSFPTGPSTLGRHGHGTRKHGPSTARPGSHRARAWHGPTLVPCLGRNVGPWAGPGTARLTGRHDGGPLFSAVG